MLLVRDLYVEAQVPGVIAVEGALQDGVDRPAGGVPRDGGRRLGADEDARAQVGLLPVDWTSSVSGFRCQEHSVTRHPRADTRLNVVVKVNSVGPPLAPLWPTSSHRPEELVVPALDVGAGGARRRYYH